MEPYMATHDIVIQENDAYDHLNTGWMYLRQSQITADAWNSVYEMDLQQTSRDQYNFNTVLDTSRLRQWENGSRPLKSDFVAANGLKIRVLDDNLFRSYHFLTDRIWASRDSSLVSVPPVKRFDRDRELNFYFLAFQVSSYDLRRRRSDKVLRRQSIRFLDRIDGPVLLEPSTSPHNRFYVGFDFRSAPALQGLARNCVRPLLSYSLPPGTDP